MPQENLDQLSDLELRRRLVECGFQDFPVTETTRRILQKKLEKHLEKERKERVLQTRKSTSAASRSIYTKADNNQDGIQPRNTANNHFYSPYEADANQNHMPIRRTWNTATTNTANVVSPPPPATTLINNNNSRITGRPLIRTTPTRITTIGGGPSSTSSKMYTPPPILAADSDEDSDYKSYLDKSNQNTRRSYSVKNTLETPTYTSNLVQAQNQHCGVVNRLLSFRDATIGNRQSTMPTYQPLQQPQRYATSDESDSSPTRISGRRTYRPPSTTRNVWLQIVNRLKRPLLGFKQMFVPHVLLGGFVIFFLVIAFFYLIKNPDLPNLIHENNTQYRQCKLEQLPSDSSALKPLSICLDSESLAEGVALSKELIGMLQQRAKHHYCVDQQQPVTLTTQDFMRFLYDKSHDIDVRKTLRRLQTTVYLIKHNPQWKIGIVDAQGLPVKIDDVDRLSPNKETNFLLLKPNLPLSCVFRKKMHRFFIIIGTGSLISVIGLGIFFVIRYITQRRRGRQAAVEQFTQEIINELIYHASQTDLPEDQRDVIIHHLRDKLIPLNKRNTLLWSWNEALRLLEANDSRVQFGITVRNGEEYRCMRWSDTVLDKRDLSCRKQWQSPAFDNGNKIVTPPTPCLKIRHMFDSSEVNHPNLKQIIEEAILEKVGPRCNITDIQLDRQSCCVYVRCATEQDAGIVHNEINGWWFDKRLVSIKFLRLQRYLTRFPKST